MSVEGQVLGASVVAGGTGGAAASLANTGNPAIIGIATSLVMIVILGVVTRKVARQN